MQSSGQIAVLHGLAVPKGEPPDSARQIGGKWSKSAGVRGMLGWAALSAALVAKSIEMEKVCPRKCEMSCPRVSADRSRHPSCSTCLFLSKLQIWFVFQLIRHVFPVVIFSKLRYFFHPRCDSAALHRVECSMKKHTVFLLLGWKKSASRKKKPKQHNPKKKIQKSYET